LICQYHYRSCNLKFFTVRYGETRFIQKIWDDIVISYRYQYSLFKVSFETTNPCIWNQDFIYSVSFCMAQDCGFISKPLYFTCLCRVHAGIYRLHFLIGVRCKYHYWYQQSVSYLIFCSNYKQYIKICLQKLNCKGDCALPCKSCMQQEWLRQLFIV
jgi:hypothetical protein